MSEGPAAATTGPLWAGPRGEAGVVSMALRAPIAAGLPRGLRRCRTGPGRHPPPATIN